jgi:hypothetical protein
VQITLGRDAARGIAELGLEVPVVGRAFVVVSRDAAEEPRLGTGVTGNPLWGVDVRDYEAGDVDSLADLPPGDYYVQAFLNVYTTFHRSDGHVVEAHLNSGAFQDPFEAPGNAYSQVQRITVGAGGLQSLRLTLDKVIQPPRPLRDGEVLQQGNFADTEWVK